jgi:hypothetical protein
MMKKGVMLSFLFLAMASVAHSQQQGCKLTPGEINFQATEAVKLHYKQKTPLDRSLPVNASAHLRFKTGDDNFGIVNGEGLLVPLEVASYTIYKPLMITAKLSPKTDAVYLCLNDEDDISKAHVTLYFLHGQGLERGGFANGLKNLFLPKELKISPIRLSLLGLDQSVHLLDEIFAHIPIINYVADFPLDVLAGIQGDVEGALATIDGLGVERIVIRNESIEFATGVDLNDPTKANVIKTIKFPQPLLPQ